MVRRGAIWLTVVAVLAAALTGFYFAHEDLPKAVRAPTSLILAPVAVVDGACYGLGLPGIYGKAIPVFLVNVVTAGVGCWSLARVIGWWQRRKQVKHAEPGDATARRR